LYDGRLEALDILVKVRDDLIPRHKAIAVSVVVFRAGHPKGPVGRDQREGIPALAAPDVARLRGLLQHDVLAPILCQVVAHRQPGLPAADDHCFYMFHHFASPYRHSAWMV
jgi:hypothetical protein